MENLIKLPENLLKAIEEKDFTVTIYEDEIYFGKFSSAGQDFSIVVNVTPETEISDIRHDIWEIYYNFDVSEETYLWLDSTGHGKNGAPYDMKDIYEDMEECQSFILELYNIFRDYPDTESEN